MNIEHNKAIVRRWSEELWGQGNLAEPTKLLFRIMSGMILAILFRPEDRRM